MGEERGDLWGFERVSGGLEAGAEICTVRGRSDGEGGDVQAHKRGEIEERKIDEGEG